MSNPDEARATQLRNIEVKTGHDLAALSAAIAGSGRVKHGEVRAWLMETYALGYGDANGLAHFAAQANSGGAGSDADPLDEIYAGKKPHLRAVHEAVLAAVGAWGDFDAAPKKGYVSLRRKKQFATIGPKTAERAELGLNLKEDAASARIVALKPGGMCQYAVALSLPGDLDDEVLLCCDAPTTRRADQLSGLRQSRARP